MEMLNTLHSGRLKEPSGWLSASSPLSVPFHTRETDHSRPSHSTAQNLSNSPVIWRPPYSNGRGHDRHPDRMEVHGAHDSAPYTVHHSCTVPHSLPKIPMITGGLVDELSVLSTRDLLYSRIRTLRNTGLGCDTYAIAFRLRVLRSVQSWAI